MNYELLLVEPRSLFAAYGQMLHCSTKSNLVSLLGNLLEGTKVKKVEEEGRNLRIERDMTKGRDTWRVTIFDAEVQALEKPDWINNNLLLSG